MQKRSIALAIASLALATASFVASAADHVFSNTTAITIPATGTGPSQSNPYPSAIAVSGLTGNIDNVRVTLNNLSHTFPSDIDIMLVSPGGQQVMLMSDAGSGNDINGVNLTFSATASGALPNGQITSGTYLPTNYVVFADTFSPPAPAPTGATDLTVFNGPASGANGTWNLYVMDNAGADSGSMAGGWTLTIADAQSCATEGYTYTKLEWCKNICERGYTGATLDMWIRRWIERYRQLPYCAVAPPPPAT